LLPPFATTALWALPRQWRPLPFFFPHARLRLMEAIYAQHLYLEAFVNQELPQVQLQKKYLFLGLGLVGESYSVVGKSCWFKIHDSLSSKHIIYYSVSRSIMVYSVKFKISIGANKIKSCCQ
jgi:hypothetical protein